MAVFTDDFTGTNGDELVDRAGWTEFGSGTDSVLQINSNALIATGSDSPTVGQAKGGANHWSEIVLTQDLTTIGSGTAQDRFSLCVRVHTTNGRNERVNASFDPDYGGLWGIYGSGAGRLGSVGGFAADVGTRVRMEADGNDGNLYIDGVLALTVDISGLGDANQNVAILANYDGVGNTNIGDDWKSGLVGDDEGGGGGGGATPHKFRAPNMFGGMYVMTGGMRG
jgi:hypothetical protein